MKKLMIAILIFLSLNIVAAQQYLNPDCRNDASRRPLLGDYCMIVVTEGFVEGIDGYYPIGAYLEFVAADGTGEMGRIYGYGWIAAEQGYHYYVVTRPIVGNRIYPLTDVAPTAILRASEELWDE